MSARWAPVVRAANYGTATNPAAIQTLDHNEPKPTMARVVAVAPFIDSDARSFADRILDQQWRDAGLSGLFAHVPASVNPVAPGEQPAQTVLTDLGAGLFQLSGPELTSEGDGLFTVTSIHLVDDDELFTYTNAA